MVLAVDPDGGSPSGAGVRRGSGCGRQVRFLETFAATKNLPAVKNKCFLPLAYDEVTPGPRNAAVVVAIALLHPAALSGPRRAWQATATTAVGCVSRGSSSPGRP